MKHILTLFVVAAVSLCAYGQKIVIGGKVPEIKGDKVEWLTSAPAKGRAVLYDFYSSDNPSCVKEYAALAAIYTQIKGKVDIILISPIADVDFNIKATADGGNYYFGVNSDKSVFAAFGVQYLPFYMLVNGKGEMVWQGNISTIQKALVDFLN